LIFDHVFDGISIYDDDPDPSKRTLVECNDRYAAMAGRSREELLNLGITQGLQIALEDTANSIRLKSLALGESYQGAFSWIRPDKKQNTVEYVAIPVTWRGKPYSIGIDRDITERKRAEETLREREQKYRNIFENVQDVYYEASIDGTILEVSPSIEIMSKGQFQRNDLIGKSLYDYYSVVGERQALLSVLKERGSVADVELMLKNRDGSLIPCSISSKIQLDAQGNPKTIIGSMRDITERKKAEEHLRESEEQFRLIAENVADMIAVLDLEGRRIYNSPSYRSVLGDPGSLKGTDGYQEIHPDDRERVRHVFEETVSTGVGQRIQYRLMRKDGSERTIDSKGSVIRDGEGKIFRVVVVSRDVTEEKMLAAQFLRSQRMESIGTLAGGIAHDLNNVLAPIMMAIEILRTKIPDPGGQKILSTIETSAQRGADIVRQVLAFGQGVKGDRKLVQLEHIVIEVIKIAGQTFPKSIAIETNIPRDLSTVLADPTQMHQVFMNILVNARDAMPFGGTLTIAAENVTLDGNYSRMHAGAKPGLYVSMSVSDTGTGVPADIQGKIFEPFFTTKEIGKGTGLGLSTTVAIVKSHGGFINLYSEEGKGTTFRIYIPATGTTSCEEAANEEVVLPGGNDELILVIDDEAAIREITKETLQAHGYKVMTASDGAEGVAIFAEDEKNIRVVITDIMMPVMDGTAAILAIKRIRPDVKIIAASGLATRGEVTPPRVSNVEGFLTKPYTAESLLKTLRAVLR
jgi:PAS domain S-box-containing protein